MYNLFKFKTIIITAGLFLSAGLFAETQFYEAKKPIGDTVADLINQMGDAGLKYSVRKIYNAKVDGTEGMLVRFKRTRAMCEIRFYQDAKIKNRSMIRILAQDQSDADRLHTILINKMKMKLAHVSRVKPVASNGKRWPVKVPSR